MNEKGSRNSQLSRINEVSFAVDDMLLYLDTHPCDRKALEYCDELVKEVSSPCAAGYSRCW